MRINQFHSGTAVGDAITNQMFFIQQLLREQGYDSDIYAEHIPTELVKKIKPIGEYNEDENGILFVHHSMGFDCFDQIINLSDQKALIYHNITPEKFFEDDGLKKYIRLGLYQAKEYKKYVKYSIAASNYNRKQLIHMGYSDVDVLPVQISLNRFDKVVSNDNIRLQYINTKNIVFIGRVVNNKCQNDVIKAFAVYNKYYNQQSSLFIIGDDSMQGYIAELKNLAKRLDVYEKITFTGKVSEEDLKAYYEIADIFLCMSEHEGFGVPILEAMKMKVPVIAYSSSAIPETMNGAGVLFTEKNYAYVGALIDEVIEDKTLYEGLINKQLQRIIRLEKTDTSYILNKVIDNMNHKKRDRTIQLQGPFETSYSLAIVNRKLMEAMDDIHKADISIYCTEGPGDYEPRQSDLADKFHAEKLWKKSAEVSFPDVTIRNMYPPRVADVNGGLNFQQFGWEESVIPEDYINNFNKYLSGIGTMSDYVTQKLIECGLKIPVKTMGIGVELAEDYISLKPYQLKSRKNTKLLHISSAFPRKGVDVLLNGYYKAFSAADDVCLILKTFPNPHNQVDVILKELNQIYSNPPEVEWINRDMPQEELYSLYRAADCYVQTARGEGFGLPVAEAMLARIPVIVSANSGMADFCNNDTALLIGYDLAPASTHLTKSSTKNSMWSEPKLEELITQLLYFVKNKDSDEIKMKVESAYNLISTKYTWNEVANRWYEFIEEIQSIQKMPKVAMVSTWNNKCGIAEFTKMEVEASDSYIEYEVYPNYGVELLKKDEECVKKRMWHSAFEGDLSILTSELENCTSEIIHFQFNFGFFNLSDLAQSLKRLAGKKKLVITFHKTADTYVGDKLVSLKSITDELNLCSALVVHQEQDRVYLEKIGINSAIVKKITLGQILYQDLNPKLLHPELKINSTLVLGSYGFLLPHKGIKETIQAVALLKKEFPDILYLPVCALHDCKESKTYLKECILEIEHLDLKNNVRFVTEFLPNEDSLKYLQACNILIMAYNHSKESASGAIRLCIAANRPIITTKQPIFSEFEQYSYQIEKADVQAICSAVKECNKEAVARNYLSKMKDYAFKNSWYATSRKFYDLYSNLIDG